MAEKYALVPESWLNKNESQVSDSRISVHQNKRSTTSDVVELLPKNLRSKARLLVHYLDGKLNLNDNQRIVYSDGYVGSHLLDMIRYYVSPLVKTRPLDAPRFDKLITEFGVPESALARRSDVSTATTNQSNEILARWKPY